jgi:hypothetical protein
MASYFLTRIKWIYVPLFFSLNHISQGHCTIVIEGLSFCSCFSTCYVFLSIKLYIILVDPDQLCTLQLSDVNFSGSPVLQPGAVFQPVCGGPGFPDLSYAKVGFKIQVIQRHLYVLRMLLLARFWKGYSTQASSVISCIYTCLTP